jgi:GntR family transcriptional repressor for pyruvate dehydrogenase complex
MTDEPLVLNTVGRNPNLYQTVSDQLLAAIRAAGLAPGSKIPSERELGEQFGVSRTVVRESIRHLAAKGVLETQSGSGVRVANVGHEGISESLELFLLQRGPLNPEKINEVRECLELQTVALAAARATDEQLQQISAACERMLGLEGNAEEASVADVQFHRAIAEATDNELFLVLVDSMSEVLMQVRRATLGEYHRCTIALEQHRNIANALQQRDAVAAVEAMRFHLADSLVAFKRTL